MIRVIIICEGQTEREFCQTILAPHFAHQGIYISAPLIKRSMGGIVGWKYLHNQIENHLKAEKQAYVTTLIDYYGLYQKHEFPGWDESLEVVDPNSRMEILEASMLSGISENLRIRFLPYIQLHEFEALLFCNQQIFYDNIPENELIDIPELVQTFESYDNPELINNGPTTAPSKRLQRIILGYDKIVYGNILIESIGLDNIRNNCPRFNQWLTRLENIE